MTSLGESEAHFKKRAEDFRTAPATVQALQSHGFTTLGHLANAVGQPGQVIPEAEFNTFAAITCQALTLRRSGDSCLRAKPWPSNSSGYSLLNRSPQPSASRDRMAVLRNSLSGLCVEGLLEPGKKLLDECCHEEATGSLRASSSALLQPGILNHIQAMSPTP